MAVLFGGLGLLALRLARRRVRCLLDVLDAAWLGWGAGVLLLIGLNFGLPIGLPAFLILLALGAAGLALGAGELLAVLRERPRPVGLLAGALCLAALWLVHYTSLPPRIYDTGLYHLNAVRWAAEYPVVPGLANLHVRLGLNNSAFLYFALLDIGPLAHRVHIVGMGFLILLTLARCLAAGFRLWPERQVPDLRTLFDALFLAPLVVWTIKSGEASSLSPDGVVFLLQMQMASMLLSRPEEGQGAWRPAIPVAFLAAIGMTVKLSSVAFGVTAAVAAVALARSGRSVLSCWRPALRASAAAGVVLVVWGARGIVLSGYPVFPATVGAVNVEWRVPEAIAQAFSRGVESWARLPGGEAGAVLADRQWLPLWGARILRHYQFAVVLPLALAFAGALVALVRRAAGWRDARGRILAVLLPPAAGLAFWLVVAPDPRFAGGCFWILGLGCLSPALYGLRPALAAGFAVLFALLVIPLTVPARYLARTWRNPGPAPRVSMRQATTASGLTVFLPAQGDQCWDSPLPSSPRLNPRLRLRVENDVRSGFTLLPKKTTP